MNGDRFPPDDAREWLRRARSNLSQAEGGVRLPGVCLEDLCFQAQQAAEKAMKGAVSIAEAVIRWAEGMISTSLNLLSKDSGS